MIDKVAAVITDHESAVDVYIQFVLDAMDRIENEQQVSESELHHKLLQFLRDGSVTVGEPKTWRITSYALAAWTDELLVETDWQGRQYWSDRVLEVELFGTRVASEKFFQLAQEVSQEANHPSLRAFYLAVLLGFRGVYGRDGGVTAAEFGLPPTLSQWLDDVRSRLRAHHAASSPPVEHRRISGAPPLDLRRRIVWWSVAAGTLMAVNVTVYSLLN